MKDTRAALCMSRKKSKRCQKTQKKKKNKTKKKTKQYNHPKTNRLHRSGCAVPGIALVVRAARARDQSMAVLMVADLVVVVERHSRPRQRRRRRTVLFGGPRSLLEMGFHKKKEKLNMSSTQSAMKILG
jgi:hypothetical protein